MQQKRKRDALSSPSQRSPKVSPVTAEAQQGEYKVIATDCIDLLAGSGWARRAGEGCPCSPRPQLFVEGCCFVLSWPGNLGRSNEPSELTVESGELHVEQIRRTKSVRRSSSWATCCAPSSTSSPTSAPLDSLLACRWITRRCLTALQQLRIPSFR